MQRFWIAGGVLGVTISFAFFSASLVSESSFTRVAQELTIERVRQRLQTQLSDETVSTNAAKRLLESLPANGSDFTAVDRDRMRELLRGLGEHDVQVKPFRSLPHARSTSKDVGAHNDASESRAANRLEQHAAELVREVRVASAACALLFGLACWLRWHPTLNTDASTIAARISASGGALIGSLYAVTWCCLGAASHGYSTPVVVVATSAVLAIVSDGLFNGFRVTRAALEISRFWP